MKHDGIEFHFDGRAHRFDFQELVGKSVYLYPQHEVLKDLIAARERDGRDCRCSSTPRASVEDAETRAPHASSARPRRASPSRSSRMSWSAPTARARSRAPRSAARSAPATSASIRSPGTACSSRHRRARDELIYSRSEEGFVLISTRDQNVQRMYFQCDPRAGPDVRQRRRDLGQTTGRGAGHDAQRRDRSSAKTCCASAASSPTSCARAASS